MKTELELARIAYKRARTRHENEQAKGLRDIGVRQTRRMHFAAENLRHAYGRWQRAERDFQMENELQWRFTRQAWGLNED